MVLIGPELLAILVCPVPTCRGRLVQRDDRLVCTVCGRRYPVTEHFPVLLPEEAEPPQER